MATLSSRVAYESPWLRVREDETLYAGGTRGLYSYIDKADFALVIPYEDDGFWLVEQYRYPVRSRQWEFPQGGWPAGHSGSPAELAAAELVEETGLTAGTLRHLTHQYAAYGHSNQGYDIYLATDLVHGEPKRESTEQDMRSAWVSTSQFRSMVRDGTLTDAHTVAAYAVFALLD
jgi:ADP-ribose pyrophosphatase